MSRNMLRVAVLSGIALVVGMWLVWKAISLDNLGVMRGLPIERGGMSGGDESAAVPADVQVPSVRSELGFESEVLGDVRSASWIVCGTVEYQDGGRVANARVSVVQRDSLGELSVRESISDQIGFFVINVADGSVVHAIIEMDGCRHSIRESLPDPRCGVEAAAPGWWRIVISRNVERTGIIRNVKSGEPVAGMYIQCESRSAPGRKPIVSYAMSGASGRFVMKCGGLYERSFRIIPRFVGLGSADVRADALMQRVIDSTTTRQGLSDGVSNVLRRPMRTSGVVDFWPVDCPVIDVGNEESADLGVLWVSHDAVVVLRAVDADSRPMCGVQFLVKCPVREVVLVPELTDENGVTELAFPPFTGDLDVRADFPSKVVSSRLSVQFHGGERHHVDVVVFRFDGAPIAIPSKDFRSVSVSVVDNIGIPVAGALVTAGSVKKTTDMLGHAELSVDATREVSIGVAHGAFERATIQSSPGSDAQSIVVTLVPLAAMTLRVWQGADVLDELLIGPLRSQSVPEWGGLPEAPAALRLSVAKSGIHDIGGLAVRPGRFLVVAPNRGAVVVDCGRISGTGINTSLELRLPAVFLMKCEVVDGSGVSLANARVVVAHEAVGVDLGRAEDPGLGYISTSRTSPEGRCEVAVPESDAIVVIIAGDGRAVVIPSRSAVGVARIEFPANSIVRVTRSALQMQCSVRLALERAEVAFVAERDFRELESEVEFDVPMCGKYAMFVSSENGVVRQNVEVDRSGVKIVNIK